MIAGVNRRHKSEGGNYRVTEKKKKGAASAIGQHRMRVKKKVKGRNK